MGSDAMAVVDGEARVHGVEGLRIVDSSIMPTIVSGNLNAPTIMIGAKAADMILGRDPLPPSNAPLSRGPIRKEHRTEEARVGHEWVGTCRSRRSPHLEKEKTKMM